MATAKNKLPTFGVNAEIDDNIVSNKSNLKETGFQPNTTIKSAEMNTYMKMLISGMSGLIDSVYNSAVSQGEINAKSSSDDVKNYIVAGLNQIIKTNKVDNATHADEATTCSGNAASATKLVNTRTFNISGDATGTAQSFDGTANITIPVDVKKSAALDSTNIGDTTHPVYFDANGKPVKCNDTIANNISGNAGSASKLQTGRKITLNGDISGETTFDGSSNVTLNTSIVNTKSTQLVDGSSTGLNAGSKYQPVYFKDGVPVAGNVDTDYVMITRHVPAAIHDNLTNFLFRQSSTSTTLSGYEVVFKGANALVNVNAGISYEPYNVGNKTSPVYFENGKPVSCQFTTINEVSSSTSDNKTYFSALGSQFANRLIYLQLTNDGGTVVFGGVVRTDSHGSIISSRSFTDVSFAATGSTSSNECLIITVVVNGGFSNNYDISCATYSMDGTGAVKTQTFFKPTALYAKIIS